MTDPRRFVFLNVPYDEDYTPLFVALVAGLCCFGLQPRCAAEDRGSRPRLDRIRELIALCPRSIHDVSRVELSSGRYPRFNMPFELGLAVAWSWRSPKHEWWRRSPKHEWWLLDRDDSQSRNTLSDLSGSDPSFHGNDPRKLLQELLNIFSREAEPPTFLQLEEVHRRLDARVNEVRRASNSDTLFAPAPFRDLVVEATRIVGDTIAPRG